MKVVVTGGAGYLGTELVRQLINNPEISQILIYDNLSRGNYNVFLGEPKLSDKMKFLKADILDSRSFGKAIQDASLVYHLAARVTTPFADQHAHLFEQVNHWGTAEVTYEIEKSDVEHFVFLSSASVYGTSEEELDETSRVNPVTIYGKSKWNAEKQVRRLMGLGKRCHIVRCGNIYGFSPSMRFDSVINRFVFEANFSRRISVNGDGNQYRSFVTVDRVARVLAKIPFSSLQPGIYNLVEHSSRINEIVDALLEVFPGLEQIYVNQDLRLNQLRVKSNSHLDALVPRDPERDLTTRLAMFAQRFTF